jgi:hypothetical protein
MYFIENLENTQKRQFVGGGDRLSLLFAFRFSGAGD